MSGGKTRKEVYAVALGGCDEGLNEAWDMEDCSHSCEGGLTDQMWVRVRDRGRGCSLEFLIH